MPVAGDVVKASDRDTPIRAMLRQTVAQTLTTGVFANITFDLELVDDDAGHSTVTNTSRYVMQRLGFYLVAGLVCIAPSATNQRAGRLALNGTALNGTLTQLQASGAGATCFPVAAQLIQCTNAGVDYVELQAMQNSGGNLNTSVGGTDQSTLTVVFTGA